MMASIAGLVFGFICIFLVDFRQLLASPNRRKTMIAYFLILTAAFVISLLQILDKAPLSPTFFIEKTVRSIFYRGE